MEDPTERLQQALAPFATRMRLQRGLNLFVLSGLVLLPLAALAAWKGMGLVPLVAWVVVLLLGIVWTMPVARVARATDAALALDAATDTALHLLDQGHPAADAVALDALDALSGKLPPPIAPPPRLRWLAGAVLLALALFLAPRWLDREPELGPETATAPLFTELEAIEDEARRKGQEELVEAVRELRARVETARSVPTPPSPRQEVVTRPPPPPPPAPTEAPPPPEAVAPPEFETQQAFEQAIDLARVAMASDDQVLAEFAAEIEKHLMDVTELEDLGVNLLNETLLANEDQDLFGGMGGGMGDEAFGGAWNEQQDQLRQSADGMEEVVGQTIDVSEQSGRKELDVADPAHDRAQGLRQSYQDFLEEYSKALRDELMEAMEEAAENERDPAGQGDGDFTKEQGAFEDGVKGDELTGEGLGEDAQIQSLSERPPGAEAATKQMMSQSTGGKPTTAEGIGGGDDDRQANGGGSSTGTGGGADSEREGADGDAGGALEQLSGQLGPGSLTPQQREAMLDSMSEMSVAAGPGSEFDDRYGGYFEEVERALIEEDLPPMMEGMVKAYFSNLQNPR